MDMVRHTEYGNQFLAAFGNNAGDVLVKRISVFRGDKILPAFDGEDDLNINLGICVCHFCTLRVFGSLLWSWIGVGHVFSTNRSLLRSCECFLLLQTDRS